VKSKNSASENRGIDILSNVLDIPNHDLLEEPTISIPTPSMPLESISSDFIATSDNYYLDNNDIDSIISTSTSTSTTTTNFPSTLPFSDSIPLDLNIASNPSSSPCLNSDSIAFGFPKNTTVIGVDSYNASIPLELPTFTIAIDESLGAQSNINNQILNVTTSTAPTEFQDFHSLEVINAQNLIVHSQNNYYPSYGEYITFYVYIFLNIFSVLRLKSSSFSLLNGSIYF